MKRLISILLLSLLCMGASASAMARCGHCGRVTDIQAYDTHRSSTGGTIAGAVVGGLLGNQIGGGNGKKLATVAGAVGGGYAGRRIAENSDKTRYRVTVRLDNGDTEVVKQSNVNHLRVGNYVRIRNGRAVRL